MSTPTTDLFEAFPAAALQERRNARSPKVKATVRATLVDLAAKLSGKPVMLPDTAAMSLTARHPYDPAGFMDVYHPGRWDCESNLVFMDVIRQVGQSAGEWDGSVVYARFKAPSNGTYLVVGNFSGYQITMNLQGPCTSIAQRDDARSRATALWAGTAGTRCPSRST